ncbi:IS4 family transposase [Legionella pneumophila]|uniref:IS4 family transposase n=1 Tax=Legionella pneumophila TaxID=446 RepID=UPI00101ECEE5|nr:IS4 family transposase [Legionella pneumophila]RYX03723.1 IS4 family transposase [Legionella pneumophila]
MQVSTILHQLLSLSIHKTRLKGLIPVITALIKSKKLQLSELGRSLSGKSKERSGIRLIDNLLSNPFYQRESILIYRSICERVIGNSLHPDIIVDWSSIPNSHLKTKGGEHCVLRAVLATTGRGITLYEEVHPKKKENNAKVHKQFLNKLQSILPQGCCPCILSDAGFKNPWFKAVSALGWDYLGRVRGLAHYDEGMGYHPINELFSQALNKARYLGFWLIAKTNPMIHHIVLYKGPSKGRHKMTKTKRIDRSKASKKHSNAWKEPWCLLTSLPEVKDNPHLAVLKYKKRMTIEENFRDTKSTKYGFSFDKNETIKSERFTVWLMLAALASLVCWLTGAAAEQLNLHYDFQANSYKHRRVLSFFYLGCQIIRKKIQTSINWALIYMGDKYAQ